LFDTERKRLQVDAIHRDDEAEGARAVECHAVQVDGNRHDLFDAARDGSSPKLPTDAGDLAR
jgi:hypothetical protein